MRALKFRIVNVFTQGTAPFSGNPLCVFEDGSELDTVTMQALARQFNLSETTFLLPSTVASARIRIFTPNYEIPFAGHPTLGSAHVSRALGLGNDDLTLETQAGVIPVRAAANRWTLQPVTPTWYAPEETTEQLAAALGIHTEDIAGPPLWVSAGKEQLIVPLQNAAAVQRVEPRAQAFTALRSREPHAAVYVFAFTTPTSVTARFFFPQGAAILEDPATGSATANFGGWLLAQGRGPCTLTIAQGEQVHRPSTLFLELQADRSIYVGGEVIEVASGTLTV